MKRRFCVLLNPRLSYHHSTRDLLQRALFGAARELGFATCDELPEEQRYDDIVIALEMAALPDEPVLGTLLLYNLEPLPMPPQLGANGASADPRFQFNAIKNSLKPLGHVDAVLDYCESTTRHLLEQGVRAVFLPPGYHPSLEVQRVTSLQPYPEGVWTIGMNRRDRRSTVAQSIGARFIYTRKDIYQRDRLSVTDGVHVNIHREPNILTFGAMKIIQIYLANKRFVISEPHWWSPLDNYEHYVEVCEDMLAGTVNHWKARRRRADRQRIAQQGYNFVRDALEQKYWLKRALDLLGLI